MLISLLIKELFLAGKATRSGTKPVNILINVTIFVDHFCAFCIVTSLVTTLEILKGETSQQKYFRCRTLLVPPPVHANITMSG
jgi:hypothetical protein